MLKTQANQSYIKIIKLKKGSDDLIPAQSSKFLSPLPHSVEEERGTLSFEPVSDHSSFLELNELFI